MKTGDIVFMKRPYKGYRAVESGLELEVYEDELISEF